MIEQLKTDFQFPVQTMCRLFGVSKSSYYSFKNHQPSQRDRENEVFKKEIMTSYLSSHKRYGAPKIHQDLLAKGYQISEKRVQKLMKQLGIQSIIRKKYRPVWSDKQVSKEYPNLLKQDFQATQANQKWVTDITYIYTLSDGWCYLSSILDLYSRKIIAWRLSRTMETSLVMNTLQDALATRKVTDELFLHSDRGSQYTSKEYNELLEKHQIRHSYSAKGCPYDNSCIESFHATIKKECIYAETKVGYQDFQTCYKSIFQYIEGFYNSRRRHSKLGYLCPNQFEKQIA